LAGYPGTLETGLYYSYLFLILLPGKT